MLRTLTTIATLSAVLVSLSAAHAADSVTVGTGGSASDAPFYIAQDRGYFKDENLDVKLLVLDSGAKVIAPLGTGELDVGSGALSVGFWNALARGVKFRVVADRGHTENGYYYQSVFMRKQLVDSGAVKSPKDLAGKRTGFAAQGVTSLSLLNEAAKANGFKFEDVTPVYLSFPSQIAAMQNGALDGSFLIEPQATIAANAGYGVRIANTNDFYPHQQISVLFYSDKFATERADVAARLMRAWLRGARTYNDAIKDGHIAGSGADTVVDIMAKNFSLNADLVRRMYSQAVDPSGAVDPERPRLLSEAGLGDGRHQGRRLHRYVVRPKSRRVARAVSAAVSPNAAASFAARGAGHRAGPVASRLRMTATN